VRAGEGSSKAPAEATELSVIVGMTLHEEETL
jgi:hypothetical protein